MAATKIIEGVSWVGARHPDLRVFDVIMTTQWGTSYNSYFIEGSEKTVLVDTVKKAFVDELLCNIGEVGDISKIDYIVCNHTEPDHSGSLEKVLEDIEFSNNFTVAAQQRKRVEKFKLFLTSGEGLSEEL